MTQWKKEEDKKEHPAGFLLLGAGILVSVIYWLTHRKKTPPPGLASLSGKVTDAASGQPIAYVEMRLGDLAVTYTGSDGSYAFEPTFEPGGYNLNCLHPYFAPELLPISLLEGQNIINVAMEMVSQPVFVELFEEQWAWLG